MVCDVIEKRIWSYRREITDMRNATTNPTCNIASSRVLHKINVNMYADSIFISIINNNNYSAINILLLLSSQLVLNQLFIQSKIIPIISSLGADGAPGDITTNSHQFFGSLSFSEWEASQLLDAVGLFLFYLSLFFSFPVLFPGSSFQVRMILKCSSITSASCRQEVVIGLKYFHKCPGHLLVGDVVSVGV